jgi:hypothetical protein
MHHALLGLDSLDAHLGARFPTTLATDTDVNDVGNAKRFVGNRVTDFMHGDPLRHARRRNILACKQRTLKINPLDDWSAWIVATPAFGAQFPNKTFDIRARHAGCEKRERL